MMFIVSKLLDGLLQPLMWVLFLSLAGLWLLPRRPRAGRRLIGTGLALLVLAGFTAVPDALLRSLESRHPVPASTDLSTFRGVIVLGGAVSHPAPWFVHGQVPLNEAAERMTVPTGWMHRYGSMRLVYSGGEGRLRTTGVTEADLARQFYAEQGLDPARLQFEGHSRTTRENAREVARLLGADCGPQWLLVTSAFHMPRAMREFQIAGCAATPYPVDFRTGAHTDWLDWSLVRSLLDWEVVLHEWVGLWAYRLTESAAVQP